MSVPEGEDNWSLVLSGLGIALVKPRGYNMSEPDTVRREEPNNDGHPKSLAEGSEHVSVDPSVQDFYTSGSVPQ